MLSSAILQKDITAMGTLVCRHGFLIYLMNCFTGERHSYGVVFMPALMSDFIWYALTPEASTPEPDLPGHF